MTKKPILATVFCLVLASVIPIAVVAYTPPGGWPAGQPYFTVPAYLSDLPYATWTGGYHDVMYEIQKELANIGIELEIHLEDSWQIWDRCWDKYWNYSTVDDPTNGWDITTTDWWTQFTSTIWTESMTEQEWTPPLGYNNAPWTNDVADDLLRKGIYTLEADEREFYLWAWQELFMADPPMINMFTPLYHDIWGDYVTGYSANIWFSSVDYFGLNPAEMPSERQALGNHTFYCGVAGDMPNVMSLYMSGYTQSAYQYLVQDSLYMARLDYNTTTNEFIEGTWHILPEIAADLPTYIDDTTVVIPLRDDVWWVWENGTKSELYDAYDTEFSIETVLDPGTASPSMGEFAPAIESVEVLSNTTLQSYGLWPTMYEPFAVQINLKAPFGDLLELLEMNWGAGVLPEHLLGGIAPNALKGSVYYKDPSKWCFTGPYIFEEWVPDQYVKVRVNPHYYGRDMTGIVDEVYLKIEPNDAQRLNDLKTFVVDVLEFYWAPSDQLEQALWPGHKVVHYAAPQSNLLIFNLDNPYLSNRYVRQAIAHAIPWDRIPNIIQGWGIDSVIPGKTLINPYTTYTEPIEYGGDTVSLFHETLPPYEYDLVKAQKYMDMWRYSEEGTESTLGPVGDGDFSGLVELADYYVWADAIAAGELAPPWIRPPGNDEDPDYDNTDTLGVYVEMSDYYRYLEKSNYYYPENSTTWQWSRTK